MEWASLILSAAGVIASIGAWTWACRANRQATRSLEALKQFNHAWYQHMIDPTHTRLQEDPKSGMFLLAEDVQAMPWSSR
jgi:hypothetical protein